MSSLKEVKNRISSVKSTRQITSAMKMVASAKLHKAQGRIENMLPYQRKLSEILTNFLRTDASFESPYTEKRPVTRVAVVAFSSNSSLCGAFNSNVAKMLERALEDYQSLGKENILIYPVGRKVEEAVKKMGYVPQGSYQVMADKPSYVEAYELAEKLMHEFVEKQIAILYCGTHGLLRDIPLDKVSEFERNFLESLEMNYRMEVLDVLKTGAINDDVCKKIEETAEAVARQFM